MNLGTWLEQFYFYLRAPGVLPTFFNGLIRVAIMIMVGLLILVFKNRKTTPQNEFNIIVMDDGINQWERVKNEGLTFTTDQKYEVKPDALYRLRPGLATRIRWYAQGIKAGFLIVFKKDKAEAIKYEKPKRTAETLRTVEESRALGKALADEFREAIGGRTIFIVIAVVVVGVLVYYFYTGRIG